MVKTVLPLSLAGLGVLLLIVGGLLIGRRPADVHREDAAEVDGDQYRVPQVQ
jgi:hypothetical protein